MPGRKRRSAIAELSNVVGVAPGPRMFRKSGGQTEQVLTRVAQSVDFFKGGMKDYEQQMAAVAWAYIDPQHAPGVRAKDPFANLATAMFHPKIPLTVKWFPGAATPVVQNWTDANTMVFCMFRSALRNLVIWNPQVSPSNNNQFAYQLQFNNSLVGAQVNYLQLQDQGPTKASNFAAVSNAINALQPHGPILFPGQDIDRKRRGFWLDGQVGYEGVISWSYGSLVQAAVPTGNSLPAFTRNFIFGSGTKGAPVGVAVNWTVYQYTPGGWVQWCGGQTAVGGGGDSTASATSGNPNSYNGAISDSGYYAIEFEIDTAPVWPTPVTAGNMNGNFIYNIQYTNFNPGVFCHYPQGDLKRALNLGIGALRPLAASMWFHNTAPLLDLSGQLVAMQIPRAQDWESLVFSSTGPFNYVIQQRQAVVVDLKKGAYIFLKPGSVDDIKWQREIITGADGSWQDSVFDLANISDWLIMVLTTTAAGGGGGLLECWMLEEGQATFQYFDYVAPDVMFDAFTDGIAYLQDIPQVLENDTHASKISGWVRTIATFGMAAAKAAERDYGGALAQVKAGAAQVAGLMNPGQGIDAMNQ